jgi:hypothetical protein
MFNRESSVSVSVMENNYKMGKALRMGQKIDVMHPQNSEFLAYLENKVDKKVEQEELKGSKDGIPLFDGKSVVVEDLELLEQKGNYFLKLLSGKGLKFFMLKGDDKKRNNHKYLNYLAEKGFRMELELVGGPVKVYNNVIDSVYVEGAPLTVLLKLMPLAN